MSFTAPSTTDQKLQSYLRYKSDPWAFLTECVYTLDQVSKEPIKLFPNRDYLRYFVRCWQNHKLIAVPKSRRMTMSWTNIGLTLWNAIFHPGTFHAFISKKEDDAKDLVARAEFIYRHIPPDKIPKDLLPKLKDNKMTIKPPTLDFTEIHSKIQGFPSGADQLRQFTFTSMLGDECAFWDNAQKFYSASKPTLDGGGRMTLISSRAPGFFKKIVFDQLNANSLNFPEVPPLEPKRPMQGVELWINPNNNFLVFDCHYSADPEKRAPEWREALKRSMPVRDFLMEYEKSWQTFEGLPVFPDFKKGHHSTHEELEIEPGLPLLIGWDFGLTPAAIVCQLVDNQLRVHKEYIAQNMGIKRFYPKVMNSLRQLYPAWNDDTKHFYHFVDPAGFKKSETDESTCRSTMYNLGARNISPGPMLWEPRKQAVEKFLTYYDKEGPGLLISEHGCPTLVEAMNGGYRYNDSVNDLEPTKVRPLKDAFSHPCDAFQYVCDGAAKRTNYNNISIPSVSYNFSSTDSPTSTQGTQYGRPIKS